MRHIWLYQDWAKVPLKRLRYEFVKTASNRPKLGDLTVRDLCCLAKDPWLPIGLYVFTDGSEILYTGKTHGRSFHERMISHLDHRKPVEGSPHLAQLVQSVVKKGDAVSADEAVQKVLDMRIAWLPVPDLGIGSDNHKKLIAMIERRLLWKDCLDPRYNSPRVKKNDVFTLKGERYQLTPDVLTGCFTSLRAE